MVRELMTVGGIARRLNRDIHHITYVIERRRIQPVQKAGVLRLFEEVAVEQIRSELTAIQARRRRGTDNAERGN